MSLYELKTGFAVTAVPIKRCGSEYNGKKCLKDHIVTLAQKQCNCQMSTFQERQKTVLFQTFTFRRLRAASSVVRGLIWQNFKLIQALMYVIITCKYGKDPIKNNREKVATPFFKL